MLGATLQQQHCCTGMLVQCNTLQSGHGERGADLVQSQDSPLEDGQRLGVDGLSVIGPAGQDVPPSPVSLSQTDTQRVWQEEQSQDEANHVEGGCSPELVPASRCQAQCQHGQHTHVHEAAYPYR